MDTLGKSKFENLGLQTSLKEVFNFQAQNIIKLHLGLIQHSNADKSTKKSIT